MAELKTFLFTDICGSVRLKGEMAGRSVTERDQAFVQSILLPHRSRIEQRLHDLGGRVVSTAGDGHFLVFDNTVQAAQWAIDVQQSHRDEPIQTPSGDAVQVRVSMHVGVPQKDPSDDNNFIGKSVDYAARLNDYATGGQILVSRSVMAILDDVGLEDVRLHCHGKKNLKGIGQVEVHELLYDDHGPRSLRAAPKGHDERQWTVLPTMAFEQSPGGTALAVGKKLTHVGNYELEELLGAGGMGDVYRARHTQFGRVRAVKVIKPQFVSAGHGEMVRRFYNEIKAIGRLEHPNIVVAIDSSAPTDDVHYLVMEYVDGLGADELVHRHGPLPIAEACEIIRQAARGLQYIHKNDMVHRDVKPSNLMVTLESGERNHHDAAGSDPGAPQAAGPRAVVKILDLGLALLADDGRDRLTRLEHSAMGTGMYMSPEQWKTSSVDIRADVYSLGCTLYHLLAGNPPFYDSDLRPEKAHEKSAVPPIRTGMQPLPKKLWEVLRTMLQKRPEDRYATPAEAAAALAPFCEGQRLAELVQASRTGGAAALPASRTQTNGSASVETWRSKSRNSRIGGWAPQEYAVTAAKALCGAAAIVAVFWLFHLNKQNYLARARESAAKSLAGVARTAAGPKGDLSVNISRRFQLLSEAAADPALAAALESLARQPDDAQLLEPKQPLDNWIGELAHRTELEVESWFVVDAEGRQIARSPRVMDDDTVGENFRHRDYFHGQGHDLSDPEAIRAARAITRPCLSAVYASETTKKLKVAFSIPIWAPAPTADRSEPSSQDQDAPAPAAPSAGPIGVLAMSVNVADFEVLDADYQGGKEVVLIDLRPDHQGKYGLILHHPKQKPGELQRIDDEVLAQIQAARPAAEDFRSEQHFLDDYRDPFFESQRFWGAFQPVAITLPKPRGGASSAAAAPPTDGGVPLWIVLAQEPRAE